MKAISLKTPGKSINLRSNFGIYQIISYLCSAKYSRLLVSPAELRLMLGHITGFFYARIKYISAIRLSYPYHYLVLRDDNLECFATGYDSRFSVYKRNIQDCMKAISLKTPGKSINLRSNVVFSTLRYNFSTFCANFALQTAAISAALCFAGLLFESDALQLTAGSVALVAVYCSTKSGKEVEND